MSDSDYLTRAEAALAAIERALDDTDADIELERSGNVLTLEFANRSKIIVNLQPPMSEIWIAAKAGGFTSGSSMANGATRAAASEFFAALSEYATQQAGEPVRFTAYRSGPGRRASRSRSHFRTGVSARNRAPPASL